MKIDILTLFPKMFRGPFAESIVQRAQDKSLVEIKIHDLRNWTKNKHQTVDDRPFGGGVGMVLMVEPIDLALQELKSSNTSEKSSRHHPRSRTILLTPQGKTFTQSKARQLAKIDHLILICGHYEGVDERIREHLIDEEVSIGDYVLTGGELPAMVITDAIVRLIPGVLKKPEATKNESFSPYTLNAKTYPLLVGPQYTRPADYKGWQVPEILLSGDHAKIDKWRKKQSLARTRSHRPDLLK